MADKINDGGPAFPQTNDSWQGPHAVPEGMSLRDFIADAMLKARELRHASQS